MNPYHVKDLPPVRIKPYILALTLIWSALVIGLWAWDVIQIKQGSLDLATIQARESLKKDIIYRRWNAGHGGVYVPITPATPANPYLKVLSGYSGQFQSGADPGKPGLYDAAGP
ncbi:hypothetical protein [Desulfosarcina cetonica]|uniref:hypothetical protein n=1 Tax=Desulfosarcina cetonica TaxID=90730 RepID=UPI0006D2CA79|nr:hypothetical protein [Desulfosarcina cetonica]